MENNDAGNSNDCVIVEGKDVWPEQIKNYLVELMVEEVKKGNKTTTTFSRTGWSNIRDGLKNKFNNQYTEEQLKNKFNQFRRKQRDFKKLISETGVSYSDATGKIDASNDRWEQWSKAIKTAGSIRKNGCPKFKKLCIIFGDTTASGVNAFASTQEVSDSSDEQTKEKDVEFNVFGNECGNESVGVANESKGNSKCKGKKRKVSKSSYSIAIEMAIVTMAEEARRKNDLLEVNQSSSSIAHMNGRDSQDKELEIMTECMRVLDDLDVEGNVFAKAIDVLHDCPLKRGLFLRMTDKRKIEWLKNLM